MPPDEERLVAEVMQETYLAVWRAAPITLVAMLVCAASLWALGLAVDNPQGRVLAAQRHHARPWTLWHGRAAQVPAGGMPLTPYT